MVLRKLGIKREKKPVYMFFSGKGGVGKTSIAAATSLWLSGKGRKVLIISTDPAHSLSDSFEMKIGGEVKQISKNLFGVEIDPQLAMREYKEKFTPQIEGMDYLKGLGLEDTFDIAGMTPGIDEIASFDKFLQYMNEGEYDVIIFDTAPTGHTLRFLSLPDILDSWVGKMIKIRMKFAGLANIFKKILPFGNPDEDYPKFGTEQLEIMKDRIEQARKILTDPERTKYNLVLIPEEMAILESERSLEVLKSYGIPVDSIIVNQLTPENKKCDFCMERRKHQLERLKVIRKKFRDFRIIELPLFREEVRGMDMLEKLGRKLHEARKSLQE